MRAFIVLGLVFPYQAKRLALGLGNGLGNVSEMTYFVSSGVTGVHSAVEV